MLLFLIGFVTASAADPGSSSPRAVSARASQAAQIMVTILFDNQPADRRLTTGWGFAALIATDQDRLLFDTGGDGAVLLSNMARLDIDPRSIDAIVISHLHTDHIGGLDRLLNVNSTTRVLLPAGAPVGVRQRIARAGSAPEAVAAPVAIMPGICSTGTLGGVVPEQALVIETAAGLVVMTGCAHPGIIPILERVRATRPDRQIALVMGGLHLRSASAREIDAVVVALRSLGVQKVAPSHSTGALALERMRRAYGPDFVGVGAGTKLRFQAPARR